MSELEINFARFQGQTENRLDQLEKRASRWDEAIGALTRWQVKMMAYGTVAAFGVGLLVNLAIKIMGV